MAEALSRLFTPRRLKAASAMAAFLFAWGSIAHYRRAGALKEELAKSQHDLKRLEVIVRQVEELEAVASAVRTRLSVSNDLSPRRQRLPRLLEGLRAALPAGVEPSELAMPSPDALRMTLPGKSDAEFAGWLSALHSMKPSAFPIDSGRFVVVSTASAGSGTAPAMAVELRWR